MSKDKGELNPFDFLRQECSDSDAAVRTEAMRHLDSIAALMTPAAVKNDLIPFLQTKLPDLDQVLVQMSIGIGKLVPYIGANEVSALIPLIEPICHLEETCIREAITSSVCKILSTNNPNPLNDATIKAFFEMSLRLYEGDEESESFFGRVTICYYLHDLYKATLDEDNKNSIRDIFSKLITDDFPMVREASAKCLPKLSLAVGKTLALSEFMNYLISLCGDENEGVKVIAVENLVSYAKNISALGASAEEKADLLPCVRNICYDTCWRTRLSICKSMGFFANYFTPERVTSDLLTCIIALIQDMEIEVRGLAILSVADFYPLTGTAFLTEFVPVAKMLLEDPQKEMRKGLADVCVEVAARAGQEIAANYFNDIIIKLVADADPMVRIRVLYKLPLIAEDIPSLCIRLVTSLRAFFTDVNWRVRAELCKAMPSVVKYLGTEFFSDHFLAEFLITFKDDVSEVRLASCGTLQALSEASGSDFIRTHVFPVVKSMATGDYLFRLAMLTAIRGLLKATPPEPLLTEVLALLLNAAKDSVPNIRLQSAQVFGDIFESIIDASPRLLIRSTLQLLSSDKDRDVAQISTLALAKYT